MKTIDRVGLDTAAQLTLSTGYAVAWAPGTATYVTGIKGWWEPAPMRREKTVQLGRPGTFAEDGERDERLISISGHHVAESRAAAAAFVDELAAFLGDGTAGVFVGDDADLGVRRAAVYLASGAVDISWAGGVDVGFTVHLLAPDPRKYGDTVTDSTGLPVEGGGLQWDLYTSNGVLDYGAAGDPGSVSLTNVGRAPTPVRFKLTGGSAPTGFTIRHQGTGRAVTYGEPVFPGQTLTLDGRDGTVELDGYTDRSTELTRRDWVELAPGATGVWFLEAPDASGLYLEASTEPAWW